MGMTGAERRRAWRRRHPEEAARQLAEIKGRPPRKKRVQRAATAQEQHAATACCEQPVTGTSPGIASDPDPHATIPVTGGVAPSGTASSEHARDPHATIAEQLDRLLELAAMLDKRIADAGKSADI